MPTIPNVPFSEIPVEAGYDPTTEDFPLNQSIVVLDSVGPSATNRQHNEGEKRDQTLRDRVNKIIDALNTLLTGGPSSSALVLFRDGSTAFLGPSPQDMGGFKIVNMADPVSVQDAANKTYVDTQDNTLLPLTGSRAMTGNLDLGNNKAINSNTPTAAGDLTNKTYVDTQVALQIPRDGSRAATANIDLGTHEIINLADPTSAQHAVTVTYLNTALLAEVPRDGTRAMTGNLDIGTHRIVNMADPVSVQDAANKTYVDTQDNTLLPLTGSRAMTGNLDHGGNKAVNLAAPSAGTDGTNKTYVDTQDNTLLALSGTRPMTGALQMGAFKVTGLAPGTAGTDGVNLSQLNAAATGRLFLVSSQKVYSGVVSLPPGVSSGDGTRFCNVVVNLNPTAGPGAQGIGTYDFTLHLEAAVNGDSGTSGPKIVLLELALTYDGTNYFLSGAGMTAERLTSDSVGVGASTGLAFGPITVPADSSGGATALFAVGRHNSNGDNSGNGWTKISLYRQDVSTVIIQIGFTNGDDNTVGQSLGGVYKQRQFLR